MTTTDNLVILNVEDGAVHQEKKDLMKKLNDWLEPTRNLKLRQKVVFFRMLATMVNASLTVLKSLQALRKQEKDKKIQQFYDYMIANVQSGTPLNEALKEYYGAFNDAETSIIEAGEKTGRLNLSLIQIADQTEKVDNITRKIKGAMMYPLLLITAMVGCVTILMVKVIPKLIEFFGDPAKLPGTTKAILATSNFFKNYWFQTAIVLAALVIWINIYKHTKWGKYRFDSWLLHAPVYGELLRKVVLSRFARIFANLISNGVSVVESLRIVSSAVGNEPYRERVLLLREDVRNGIKMGESLEDDPLFPDLLVQMIKVGEETAQIGETVIKIADFYDDEVDIVIGSIQKMIEPFILIIMAWVIWFIALWVFEPIMGLAGSLSER